MAEPRYCAMCGTPFPPGARFCPNCGSEVVRPTATAAGPSPVVPPPPIAPRTQTHVPPAAPVAVPSRSTYFIWVPIAVIGLGLLAWAVLSGMPFGRGPQQPERRPMDVVTEREVTTGTVAQIGEPEQPDEPEQPAPRTVTAPPRVAARPVQPAPVAKRPTAPATPVPAASRPAAPAASRPAEPAASRPTEPARAAGEISEGEALRVLQRHVVSRRDYDVTAQCVAISGLGYRNAGYTFDVRNRCSGTSLGRWRVDSKDPSGVFRQHADGRFLRP